MGAARRWLEPEDIAQRVLLEVLAETPEDELVALGESVVLSRLFRTAQTRIIDAVRKHQQDTGESSHALAPDDVGSPEPPVGPVTQADGSRWLLELVARLPEPYREVIQLCALEGRTFVAAGELLGLGPDTVRKRYEKARGLLSRKLAARGHGERA